MLRNLSQVEDDIPDFKRPSHGFLGGWADQGVLLLNSVSGFCQIFEQRNYERNDRYKITN